MTDLLVRIFVKDYKNPASAEVRERYGTFSSVVGVLINFLLAGFKLLAGILSGSVAIIADALNNLTDAGSSVVSFVSFKVASKPADRKHPFGHARIEYICSLVVSFIILLVGFELFADSVGDLVNAQERSFDFSAITFVILGISIAMKLWLAIFYRKISKRINSSVIKASSVDSLSDVISTSAVLVSSLVIKLTGLWFIDSAVGIAVSLFIVYSGIKVLLETTNSILGEAPVEDIVEQINSTVEKYPDVIGMHDLLVHNYGPNKYIVSFHAEVDGSADIFYLHDIIDNLERELNESIGLLCTIHLDPIVTHDETVSELREFVEKTVTELFSDVSIHDFRVVAGHTHTNLIFDVVLPFENKNSPEDVEKKIKEKVSSVRSDCFCVITVDRG